MTIGYLALAALSAVAAAPKSETLPFAYALVVGSRDGGSGQTALRYSLDDAARFAQLLIELGRYEKNHVRLLRDPAPEQLLNELRSLAAELKHRQARGEHSSLLFYYSGHARASGLSLRSSELLLADLREELTSTPADLVVAILDACQSGSFSRIKAVEPAPDFSVNSVAQLNTQGLAVLASSTSSELSQESDRLAGSYFTHHLMMGLRGAADLDGDGRVTLTEAYRYAYARTLVDTAATAVGSQHATLETNLRGKGDVALTYPKEASASLSLLPELQGDVLVSVGEVIVGEINKTAGTPVRLGLPPARYRVLVRQPELLYECMAELVEGQETPLVLASCNVTRLILGAHKGEVAGGVIESINLSRQPGWHFEIQLNAPLTYYSQGGPSFRASAEGSVTYYFERLIDDPAHPLGALVFLQHPSSISVKPNVQFSSGGVSSTFGGTLSTVIYPWQRTGFSASAASSFDGKGASLLSVALGIQHYFTSRLRVEAGYFGVRSQGNYRFDAPGITSTSNQDGAIADVSTLWANEKLFSQLALKYYHIHTEIRGQPATEIVVIPTVDQLEGDLATEYFLSRRFSIAAVLGLYWRITDQHRSGNAGPTVNWYITNEVLASAGYQVFFPGSIHELNLGVTWRF